MWDEVKQKMKTAMDIIDEINREKEQAPGIMFWFLLAGVGFTSGLMGAMVYAYIMTPFSK